MHHGLRGMDASASVSTLPQMSSGYDLIYYKNNISLQNLSKKQKSGTNGLNSELGAISKHIFVYSDSARNSRTLQIRQIYPRWLEPRGRRPRPAGDERSD